MVGIKAIWARQSTDGFAEGEDFAGPPSMAHFVVTGIAFLLIGSCCALALLYFHRRRRAQRLALLPVHREPGHHRQLTISTSSDLGPPAIHGYEEKRRRTGESAHAPSSPVPEIRVTFPDDENKSDQDRPRVVVVRMADSGCVGMEPLVHESLPPYQSSDADRFQSLDLERIGGLREKGVPPTRWS